MRSASNATNECGFYEPQYFHHSVTYRSWVKLFIADAYALETVEGYEGTKVRFWKNHPIRWIQLVGTVVGVVVKTNFAEITIDDGSGYCMNLYIKKEAAQSIKINFEENKCEADVGHLLKVKGTLSHDFKGELQLIVDKIQIVLDPVLEFEAWRERIDYKRNVLSLPWQLDISCPIVLAGQAQPVAHSQTDDGSQHVCSGRLTSHDANTRAQLREAHRRSQRLDLDDLDERQHTQRNLKLILLQYLSDHDIHAFSISDLRSDQDLERATVLVATASMKKQGMTAGLDMATAISYSVNSQQKYRTLNACLTALVKDGSILSTDITRGKFCTLGPWNLGALIRTIAKNWKKNKQSHGMSARDLWQAVRTSGQGYDQVNKQMVLKMAGQMGISPA